MKRSLLHGLTTLNDDGDFIMLDHVFASLDPCCVQWYKFHVHRGKGSGHIVTQIHQFEIKLISWAHSSISDGDVTTLLHIYINFITSTMSI